MLDFAEILRTERIRGNPPDIILKRTKRLEESLSWRGGTVESPHKYVVETLENNLEVYFVKPGIEVESSSRENPHDMRPCVGEDDRPYGFDEVWKQFTLAAIEDCDKYKAILTLAYRNAYMLDHTEENNTIRYKPCEEIFECIEELDRTMEDCFEYGLLGFLHFLDLLGWNEDSKYHVTNSQPDFTVTKKKSTGKN